MPKSINNRSGIYQIRNIANGKFYIGQTKDLAGRRYSHFHSLMEGKHHTQHLQRAYNKYGADNFVFEVLIFCDVGSLDYYEREFFNKLKPQYNSRPDVLSNRGRKQPPEEIERRTKSIKEHWRTHKRAHSEETKRKLSLARKAVGEQNNQAVLTVNKVLEIRNLHRNRTLTLDGIAEIFGVSQTTIVSICMRRTWKHVP